jgi:hypothetical protein
MPIFRKSWFAFAIERTSIRKPLKPLATDPSSDKGEADMSLNRHSVPPAMAIRVDTGETKLLLSSFKS